jgi:lysophospholipase L1-like esterase
MHHHTISRAFAATLLLAILPACSGEANKTAATAVSDGPYWVGTWGASPTAPNLAPGGGGPFGPTPSVENATLRQVVHLSAGGDQVRILVSNTFGQKDLTIGAAHVALQDEGSRVKPDTDHEVTFSGNPSFTIPAGATALSDPVSMQVGAFANLAVSLYFPGPTGPATNHGVGLNTGYVSEAGDHTSDADMSATQEIQARLFLSGVEVAAAPGTKTIVTFGDSITDGAASTPNTNHRWPDYLAARLGEREGKMPAAVVNEGISGNRILHDVAGPNAQARFERDVLSWPNGSYVIVLEGINDIGFPEIKGAPFGDIVDTGPITAEQLIAGHRQLIARAHARGLKIYGATLTPYIGATYATPHGDEIRQAVNKWIRESGEYDGVIDFDAAVRDPNDPSRMRADYQSGDWLHPNDGGYKAMADSIDLSLFD